MSSAPEHPPAEGGEGEAKKGSKLPLIIGAVVLLLGGGAGGAWYMGVGPFKSAEPTDAEAAADHGGGGEAGGGHGAPASGGGGHGAAKAEAKGGHGEKAAKGAHGGGGDMGGFKALDPFIANLTDQDGQRYLKASFQLEFFAQEAPHELDTRMPQIRDLVLTLISSKTFDDIRTPDGKQQLREEIIARVNQALTGDLVKNVYFTEFIVQ